ncbi:macrophage migration inhibitory factor homolog [Exaiptasia diaphana]|uniref:L-dopachrome isomerase n=1 Tax=Exaiptasia diaphana TaxID=2652724 RepID=A0A913WT74_EXADI|nr:macrophage migration inhibitory factor homolog [Exaiptasia diaphana]
MPYLQIQTNIPAAKIPDDFLKNSTTVLADMLKKPESYICVCIEPGQLMTWAGTKEPTAIVQLTNIGRHDAETTKRYTEVLGKYLVDELGVPQDRMHLIFHTKDRFEVGFNGKTFAQ